MRFDDRISTVLESDVPDGVAAHAQYIQLADLLSQRSSDLSPLQMITCVKRIHVLREAVPEAERVNLIKSLHGRFKNTSLVQYFAAADPVVASAAIAAAELDDGNWAALIPNLSVRARGFLRSRRDLGPLAKQALARFGTTDMALPSYADAQNDADGIGDEDGASKKNRRKIAEREISKIVARIEEVRKARMAKESEDIASVSEDSSGLVSTSPVDANADQKISSPVSLENVHIREWLPPRIRERFKKAAKTEAPVLQIKFAKNFQGFAASHTSVERIISRLLSAFATCVDGEKSLKLEFSNLNVEMAQMSVKIPQAIVDIKNANSFLGHADDQNGTVNIALRAIDFSFRLARKLAEHENGTLIMENSHIFLTLPRTAEEKEQSAGASR